MGNKRTVLYIEVLRLMKGRGALASSCRKTTAHGPRRTIHAGKGQLVSKKIRFVHIAYQISVYLVRADFESLLDHKSSAFRIKAKMEMPIGRDLPTLPIF
jgi:hypothetical protein